jgi:hypothetical protein
MNRHSCSIRDIVRLWRILWCLPVIRVLVPLLACTPLAAQTLPESVRQCSRISERDARLDCFDREVAKLPGAISKDASAARAQSGRATSPEPSGGGATAPATVNAPTPRAATAAAPGSTATSPAGASTASLSPEQSFGLSQQQIGKLEAKKGGPAPLKGITAHVASVFHNGTGRMVLTLDNGQVWAQIQPDSSFDVKPGAAVSVNPASLGSFFMSTSRHNWTKVQRVQ